MLVDLGAARKDKAMAEEAIAACQEALGIFRDKKMDDLAAGSEKNVAKRRRCSPNCTETGVPGSAGGRMGVTPALTL